MNFDSIYRSYLTGCVTATEKARAEVAAHSQSQGAFDYEAFSTQFWRQLCGQNGLQPSPTDSSEHMSVLHIVIPQLAFHTTQGLGDSPQDHDIRLQLLSLCVHLVFACGEAPWIADEGIRRRIYKSVLNEVCDLCTARHVRGLVKVLEAYAPTIKAHVSMPMGIRVCKKLLTRCSPSLDSLLRGDILVFCHKTYGVDARALVNLKKVVATDVQTLIFTSDGPGQSSPPELEHKSDISPDTTAAESTSAPQPTADTAETSVKMSADGSRAESQLYLPVWSLQEAFCNPASLFEAPLTSAKLATSTSSAKSKPSRRVSSSDTVQDSLLDSLLQSAEQASSPTAVPRDVMGALDISAFTQHLSMVLQHFKKVPVSNRKRRKRTKKGRKQCVAPTTTAASNGMQDADKFTHQHYPRHLTHSSLLSLQLVDCEFRSVLLTQTHFLLCLLRAPSTLLARLMRRSGSGWVMGKAPRYLDPSKCNSKDVNACIQAFGGPKNCPYNKEQVTTLQDLHSRVWSQMDRCGDREWLRYVSDVTKSESYWMQWKDKSCPPLARKPLHLPVTLANIHKTPDDSEHPHNFQLGNWLASCMRSVPAFTDRASLREERARLERKNSDSSPPSFSIAKRKPAVKRPGQMGWGVPSELTAWGSLMEVCGAHMDAKLDGKSSSTVTATPPTQNLSQLLETAASQWLPDPHSDSSLLPSAEGVWKPPLQVLGPVDMFDIWNLNPDNRQACSESDRNFIPTAQDVVDELESSLDFDMGNESYRNLLWSYRAARALRSAHFMHFVNCNGSMKELVYLTGLRTERPKLLVPKEPEKTQNGDMNGDQAAPMTDDCSADIPETMSSTTGQGGQAGPLSKDGDRGKNEAENDAGTDSTPVSTAADEQKQVVDHTQTTAEVDTGTADSKSAIDDSEDTKNVESVTTDGATEDTPDTNSPQATEPATKKRITGGAAPSQAENVEGKAVGHAGLVSASGETPLQAPTSQVEGEDEAISEGSGSEEMRTRKRGREE